MTFLSAYFGKINRKIIKIVIISFCINLFSCKSQKLSNRIFEGSNPEKRVSVQFLNDSILEIEQ